VDALNSTLRAGWKDDMQDFKLSNNSFFATFFEDHDFAEGEDRLCWTMVGLNKLIALGLWRREFDGPGNLKSKPPTVADLMRMAKEQAASIGSRQARIPDVCNGLEVSLEQLFEGTGVKRVRAAR
jgi:hypothetical protein